MNEKEFENAYRSYQEEQLPDPQLLQKTLKQAETRKKPAVTSPILRYTALAASAVMVVATVMVATNLGKGDLEQESHVVSKPNHLNNPTLMTSSAESPASSEAAVSTEAQPSTPSQSTADALDVSDQINQISGMPSFALPYLSDEFYRREKITEAALFEYLGKRVDPLLPEGLVPAAAEEDRVWEFIIDRKTNEPYVDFCGFAYADKFLEPGIPSADARVLHVIVSKKGWHFGVYYAEKEPVVTHAYGVDIVWGKVIDRPTYTAEFQADGIQYTIWGENLSPNELHAVVKSLVD